jgi:hypothetical protein
MKVRLRVFSGAPILALLCLAAMASGAAAASAADDFRVLDGFLIQPIVLPDSAVAEVSTDSGHTYYVDLRLLPRTAARLESGTPITVVGYQGERADLFYAHVLKVRELPPPPPADRASVDLRVIEGKIAARTTDTLTLRTSSGTVAVRIAGMTARLIAGELVQVLGVIAGDNSFVAKALILRSPIWRDADAGRRGADR